MSAQRVKLSTEMQFLQDRLKDGTATLQKFSMKPLAKLDKAMQPRAIHLNMDHVKNLGDILQIQLKLNRDLDPGVLFRDPASGWIGLVDGWHRLKAYQVAKMDYFPAYVIEGTKEDATEYAAMANQHAMLRRTPTDIEKQLSMLFAIPKWWKRNDVVIGNHVGINRGTVRKYRVRYSHETGLPLPETFEDTNGQISRRPSGFPKDPLTRPAIQITSDGRYRASISGKRVSLGRKNLELASELLDKKLESIIAENSSDCFPRKEAGRPRYRGRLLAEYLLSHNYLIRAIVVGTPKWGVIGYSGYGRTIISIELKNDNTLARDAIGTILPLREFDNPAHRAVVVCYPEDGPEDILDLGRRLGIEFLTPEQLVASIRGDGPDDTQAEPAPGGPDEPDGGQDHAE